MPNAHIFTGITSEGGILPADFLAALTEPKSDLDGLDPVTYRLAPGERVGDQVNRSWNRLKGCWVNFLRSIATKQPGEPTTTETRERWLYPLFQELDFGRLMVTRPIEIDGKSYPVSHRWGPVPIHLVGTHVDLDKRTPGAVGAAKASPHSLVQQVLNTSDGHLWGVISNGFTLRLLRDNVALTRMAYVEWDLQAIFDGDLYPEFFLLWLVCHQSRFEAPPDGRTDQCWIEKWKKQAEEKGLRALENLRPGVEKAIASIGAGLVSHKANQALRLKLSSGQLTTQDFYRQILRIIYRMLFLFVAEDRRLLHPPLPGDDAGKDAIGASLKTRQRYRDFYSIGRLREVTLHRAGTPHPDLWQVFQLVSLFLGSDSGCPELAIPPLGSFLWSPKASPDLNDCLVSNRHFLEAVHALAFIRGENVRRVIDYKNLGSDELGSVYESLLELHPIVNADAGTFELQTAAGHERKTSGSYYTNDSLVQCLLESALEPVIAETIKGKEGPAAADALLKLKICDLAVGSGHFLIGAGHRLARRVAAARTGEEEPSPEATRSALREVIGRCLYGVDINPMAAELCRVSLWLEALEPGKPLSFLDHHIRVGNSLLGATPELIAGGLPDEAFNPIEGDDKKFCSALKKQNKQERAGQRSMLHLMVAEAQAQYNSIESRTRGLDEAPDDTIEEIRRKAEQFNRLVVSPEYRHAQQIADAWCAAFVWRKQKGAPFEPITTDTIRRLEEEPNALSPEQKTEIERLAAQYRFFHWHLAFPEVFAKGGFDLVLGNPPWDTLSPDAKEFFSSYDPQVRFQDRAGQQRIIDALLQDPTIAQRWEANCRDLYALVHFIKQSGRYQMFAPGNLGKGDFNVYRMFVEAALSLTRRNGWASQLVPEGLYNGANCMAIRRALYETYRLDCVLGFENANEVWFKGIDTRMKFCLYAAHVGRQTEFFRAAFNIRSPDQLADVKAGHSLNIPVRLIKEFSPDALAIMELGSQMDIDIAAKMYRWPAFGDETAGQPRRVYMAEVHMGNDRELFTQDPTGVPLYEGRMVDQFDYRAKGYRSGRGRAADWEDLPFDSPNKSIQPQWYIPREKVPDKCVERMGSYRIGFCDVASPTNERTLVTSIIPPGCLCGHKVPTIRFEESDCDWYMVAWVAIANSYAMDFVARKKVSLSLTYTILDSFPFPRLDRDDPRTHGLVSRCLRLSCTGPEMIPLWNRLATEGWVSTTSSATEIPGELDDEPRLQIRAEIDATVARDLFALTRPELEYILTTFPTQQRYQEEKYGEFRSRGLILEAFEQVGR